MNRILLGMAALIMTSCTTTSLNTPATTTKPSSPCDIQGYNPVCGMDGHDYNNECWAYEAHTRPAHVDVCTPSEKVHITRPGSPTDLYEQLCTVTEPALHKIIVDSFMKMKTEHQSEVDFDVHLDECAVHNDMSTGHIKYIVTFTLYGQELDRAMIPVLMEYNSKQHVWKPIIMPSNHH